MPISIDDVIFLTNNKRIQLHGCACDKQRGSTRKSRFSKLL